MKLQSVTIATCLCSLFTLQMQIPSCSSEAKSEVLNNVAQPAPTILSQQELCSFAQSITVKILSKDGTSKGSGFLIHQKAEGQQFIYKVVTNGHVLTSETSYQIQTSDRKNHPAILLFRFDETKTGDDLAVLQFSTSQNSYTVAKLAPGLELSSIRKDKVIAAGFPIKTGELDSSQFVCTPLGEVSLLLQQPMIRGYQLGYFLPIAKGMSGGPLLNLKGEVVGVNGKHSNPIAGGRIFYVGKNELPVKEFEESPDLVMSSSWAIPIERVIPLARSRGIAIALNESSSLPSTSVSNQTTQPNWTPVSPQTNQANNSNSSIVPDNISNQQANQQAPVSPQTNQANNSNSSIVPDNSSNQQPNQQPNQQAAKPENLQNLTPFEIPNELKEKAKLITVKVMIGDIERSGVLIGKQGNNYWVLTYEGMISAGYYKIQTSDGKIYPGLESRKIAQANGDRFVVLEFRGEENTSYPFAVLASSSSLTQNQLVFAGGYLKNSESSLQPQFELTDGQIQIRQTILYTNLSQLGLSNHLVDTMVGGPLLNMQGEVIGINTKINYKTGGWTGINGYPQDYNYSWAITIDFYKQNSASHSYFLN